MLFTALYIFNEGSHVFISTLLACPYVCFGPSATSAARVLFANPFDFTVITGERGTHILIQIDRFFAAPLYTGCSRGMYFGPCHNNQLSGYRA